MREEARRSRTRTAARLPARPAVAALLVLIAAAVLGGAPRASADPAAPRLFGCQPVRTAGTSYTGGAGGLMVALTLDQLTDRSDAVIAGTVQSFQACRARGGPSSIVTLVTIKTEQALKGGAAANSSIAVTVPGGVIGRYRLEAGTSPEFTAGERVVIFLDEDATWGLVPSEGYQGKFAAGADGSVIRPGFTIAELGERIARARHGSLRAAEDPLHGASGTIESDFISLGPKFADYGIPVPIYINPTSGKPSQITAQETRQAVANAYHAWQNLSDSYIAFGPIDDTTRVSTASDCDGKADTTWGLHNPSHGSGTLAVTYTCYSSGVVLDADVEIDTDHFGSLWRVNGQGNCDGYYDLETVLLHEYGHVLGLGHPSYNGGCVNCPVMDGSYGGLQHDPCADDSDGAAALYPLDGGAPPAAPDGFSASRSGSVLLDWQDVEGEMGFEIWRAAAGCASATPGDFALHDTVTADATAYTDDDYGGGLNSGQTYCYKVRSFDQSGESAFSNTAEAPATGTTPTPTPAPTASPTPSPTATPTATPAKTPSPTASATPTPTSTATPTPTASPEQTPAPTATPSPIPTETPAPTPAPTDTPPPTASPTPTPGPVIPGDVDCDEGVDAIDALFVLRTAAALPSTADCMDHGDVDCDSDIDAVDALGILRFVARLPGPAAGDCPPIGSG